VEKISEFGKHLWCQAVPVSKALPAGWSRTLGSIPGKGRRVLFSPLSPVGHIRWVLAALTAGGRGVKAAGVVKLTTHLHVVPRLRMSRAIPPLPYTPSSLSHVWRYILPFPDPGLTLNILRDSAFHSILVFHNGELQALPLPALKDEVSEWASVPSPFHFHFLVKLV
jgi:hypothetical protein